MTRPVEISVQRDIIAAIEAAVDPVDVRAIPNGGKRTRWQAQQAKREGMKAGTPDLLVTWPGGVGLIETKRPAIRTEYRESDVSEEQAELVGKWLAWGINVAICASPESALAALTRWGAPMRGRIAA